jgi:uncharacterized protein (AIM24 family)
LIISGFPTLQAALSAAMLAATKLKNLGRVMVGFMCRVRGPGCVRLHPRNAAALYALVQGFGPGQTRISIYH